MDFAQIQLNSKTVWLQGEGELIVHRTPDSELRNENYELSRRVFVSEQKIRDVNRENVKLREKNSMLEKKLSETPKLIKDVQQLIDQIDQIDEKFVPDLVYAIKLFLHIKEFKNIKNDSYTNIANQWITKNTPYAGIKDDKSSKRLRDIVSSFCTWNPLRQKNFKEGMKKLCSQRKS